MCGRQVHKVEEASKKEYVRPKLQKRQKMTQVTEGVVLIVTDGAPN